jgi:GNAT acetyltransferase-like protein
VRSLYFWRVNTKVIGTADQLEWHDVIRRLPEGDIYFTPEYHRACEVNGDGKACAFIAEEGEHLLFHAFLLRPIEQVGGVPLDGSSYDIESVYGYSGPLCSVSAAHDAAFLTSAWSAYGTWCRERDVIAEFLRFHPLLGNFKYARGVFDLHLERETVAIELNRSKEMLWRDYPSGHRTKVRKALRNGLRCEEVDLTEGLETFKRLYRQTMARRQAQAFYFFSDAYFASLATLLHRNIRLFEVRLDGSAIAAGLFLLYGDKIHYHLGGSDPDASASRPNNLLFHTVAEWGCDLGFKLLHLGGGRTARTDDSLFRFKSSLSDLRFPFYIGKRVHNKDAYDNLCSQWLRQTGTNEKPNYFLTYRMEA